MATQTLVHTVNYTCTVCRIDLGAVRANIFKALLVKKKSGQMCLKVVNYVQTLSTLFKSDEMQCFQKCEICL